MRAMVLAAGLGTRLRPLTLAVPKPAIPAPAEPLAAASLRHLAAAGIAEAAVNLHQLPEVLRGALGDGSAYGVAITYFEEPEILGTGGGLRNAAGFLGPGTSLVMNGDCLTTVDLGAAIATHRRLGALATMVVRASPGGGASAEIQAHRASHRVAAILGRGDGMLRADAGFMFTGVHVLEGAMLDRLPPGVSCIIRDGYIPALEEGLPIGFHVHDGYWNDLGTPGRFLDAVAAVVTGHAGGASERALAGMTARAPGQHVHPTAAMGAGAILGEGVAVAAGAVIGAGARIGPAVYIGAGARVGAGAHLCDAAILAGEAVPPDATVRGELRYRGVVLRR